MAVADAFACALGRELTPDEREMLQLLSPQGVAKVNADLSHGMRFLHHYFLTRFQKWDAGSDSQVYLGRTWASQRAHLSLPPSPTRPLFLGPVKPRKLIIQNQSRERRTSNYFTSNSTM